LVKQRWPALDTAIGWVAFAGDTQSVVPAFATSVQLPIIACCQSSSYPECRNGYFIAQALLQ
jgi:hypothetical protein